MALSGSVSTNAYEGRYLTLSWSASQSIVNNQSTISWTLSANGGSSSWYSTGPVTVVIDGTTVYSLSSNDRYAMYKGTIKTGTIVLNHSSTGTKSFTVSVSGAIFTYAVNCTGTGSFTLDTIPRYPSCSQSVAEKTDTTIKMNWSSDSTCDYVWYSSDNGSHWTGYGVVNGKSGSYNITGLSPKTKYNIKTEVRRKDSQLHNQSSTLAVTTFGANYFTFALEDQTPEGSLTQIKVNATTRNTEENNTSKIYSILWEIYPSGNSSMKETVTSNNCLPDNGTVSQSFTRLLTDTAYIITASLYKGTVTGGTLVRSQSMTVSTAPLNGTFRVTARSSSVIHVVLEDMPKLEYDTRVDVSYKRDTDSTWTLNGSVNIPSGSTMPVDFLLSGLSQMTRYDFKAQVYMVSETKAILTKTFDLSTSTLAYVAGLESMIPFIKSSIIVPMSGKGYLLTGLSSALPTGMTVHLYSSSDGDTYTDLGDVGEDMAQPVTGTVGSAVYYKLALVDRNDNAYNETEPTQISFPDLIWRTRITGDPFDVTAVEMRNHANALISLYDYLAVDGSTPDAREEYDALTQKVATLIPRVVVEGSEDSGFTLIGQLASIISESGDFTGYETGDPITAQAFNNLHSLVADAIGTIM